MIWDDIVQVVCIVKHHQVPVTRSFLQLFCIALAILILSIHFTEKSPEVINHIPDCSCSCLCLKSASASSRRHFWACSCWALQARDFGKKRVYALIAESKVAEVFRSHSAKDHLWAMRVSSLERGRSGQFFSCFYNRAFKINSFYLWVQFSSIFDKTEQKTNSLAHIEGAAFRSHYLDGVFK